MGNKRFCHFKNRRTETKIPLTQILFQGLTTILWAKKFFPKPVDIVTFPRQGIILELFSGGGEFKVGKSTKCFSVRYVQQ